MHVQWKALYDALLQERDRSKLAMRNAERAIKERFRQGITEGGDSTEERLALSEALHNISLVRASLAEPGRSN
jgi:hypothetical protein